MKKKQITLLLPLPLPLTVSKYIMENLIALCFRPKDKQKFAAALIKINPDIQKMHWNKKAAIDTTVAALRGYKIIFDTFERSLLP